MVGKRVVRIVAGVAVGSALVFGVPGAAHATAVGTTPVRTFEYSVGGMTVKVPTGCMFTHAIKGSGRRITYQNAGVDCAFVGALSSGFCLPHTSRDVTHGDPKIDPACDNSPQT